MTKTRTPAVARAIGALLAATACEPVAAQDTRPAPKGPEGYARLQLRYEYRDGQRMGGKTFLSMLALDEYDCQGGRFRTLRAGVFTQHNAEGESRQDTAAGAWSKPAAGTVDAKSLAAACGR